MTAFFSLLAAVVAGGSLLVSGVLKVGRPDLMLRGMRELRVPHQVVRRPVAAALPVVEIMVGAGVLALTGLGRTLSATGALMLHLAYVALTARAARGRWAAHCHCFGDFSEGPVTWRTVIRNVVLSASAVLTLLAPSDQPQAPVGVLVAATLAVAAVALRMTRAGGAAGAQEHLVLLTADGAQIDFREFHEPPTVLVFFSPHCKACRLLMPYFRWWPTQLPPDFDLQPVFIGRPEEFAQIEEFAPLVEHAWFDPEKRVAGALGVHSSPAGVYVSAKAPTGTGTGAVGGRAQIEQLLVSHGAQVTRPAD